MAANEAAQVSPSEGRAAPDVAQAGLGRGADLNLGGRFPPLLEAKKSWLGNQRKEHAWRLQGWRQPSLAKLRQSSGNDKVLRRSHPVVGSRGDTCGVSRVNNLSGPPQTAPLRLCVLTRTAEGPILKGLQGSQEKEKEGVRDRMKPGLPIGT